MYGTGRPVRRLTVTGDPLTVLAGELRGLRESARLTLRELSRRTEFSIAALSAATSGTSLPSWKVTRAYAYACGGDARIPVLRDLWVAACARQGRTVALPLDGNGPPDPASAYNPRQFLERMAQLRAWAGVSLSELNRRSGGHLPPSTVSEALRRDRLPKRVEFVIAYVTACGLKPAEVKGWEEVYRDLRSQHHDEWSVPASDEVRSVTKVLGFVTNAPAATRLDDVALRTRFDRSWTFAGRSSPDGQRSFWSGPPPEPGPETPGELVNGRYRLLEELGRGGQGAVWRARDEVLHREVAVKEQRHVGGDGDRVERALQEARLAAQLDHPGVVVIHDVLIQADRMFIIMELFRGPSLQQILYEGPVSVRRAAWIGGRVAQALKAAHDAGVMHRDVKPANIMISNDRVALVDFGISLLVDDQRSASISGTPAFMAPEQWRGDVNTPATDMWALGATLYQAVEGRRLYAGTSAMEIMTQAVDDRDPDPPRNARELTPVISGLLRKDPARRLTAESVAALLGSAPIPG